MARNTKALVMAVSVMFSNNLYECGPIDGYKFPVYTTESCPKNKAEWLERSFGLNCTDQNIYMCIPNEMITVLVEFCYTNSVEAIPEGYCLILSKRSSAVDAYRCQDFSYGCPSDQYFSNRIYEQVQNHSAHSKNAGSSSKEMVHTKNQSCVSIMEGCFLADPHCERTVTANKKTATSKYNTEEGIGTNSITTGLPYPTFLMIIIVTIISSLIAGHYLGIVKTRITRRCNEGSTSRANDQTTEQFILHNKQNIDVPLERQRVGVEESSLNENSNPRPLTNRTCVQTTDLLISNNVKNVPLEGPRVDITESSLNENSNQGPLTNRATVQTTELVIHDNIQDIPVDGTRADETESSLNENSNQGRLTNRASVQTTELLIPDNIQERPIEGPRTGGEKSSFNRNANPRPMTNRASDAELLIPDKKQDMPLEEPLVFWQHIHHHNNVTGRKKLSLNRNSNPCPLIDRASDPTTELLIPDNIQDLPFEGPRADKLRAYDCRNLIN